MTYIPDNIKLLYADTADKSYSSDPYLTLGLLILFGLPPDGISIPEDSAEDTGNGGCMSSSGYGLWVMGSTARGLPFCAWDASQNQTRLPIPAFKVEKTTSDVESIWSRTITLVEIKLFNMCI